MIMLASGRASSRLHRMRDELSELLGDASGNWLVELTNRDVLVMIDRVANRARITTLVARVAALGEGRVERLLAATITGDGGYLRQGPWLWAQAVCPASTLEVDDLIARIAEVSRLADAVTGAPVRGPDPPSRVRPALSDPCPQDNAVA